MKLHSIHMYVCGVFRTQEKYTNITMNENGKWAAPGSLNGVQNSLFIYLFLYSPFFNHSKPLLKYAP